MKRHRIVLATIAICLVAIAPFIAFNAVPTRAETIYLHLFSVCSLALIAALLVFAGYRARIYQHGTALAMSLIVLAQTLLFCGVYALLIKSWAASLDPVLPLTSHWGFPSILTHLHPSILISSGLAISACIFNLIIIRKNSIGEPPYYPKRLRRGDLGEARWTTMREAKRKFKNGGIVIGEASRIDKDKRFKRVMFDPRDRSTWGPGGKKRLLFMPDDRGSGHGLLFGGAGSFKTTGFAVPIALTRNAPIVCFDPSTEIGPIVHKRRKELGFKVIALNPAFSDEVGFNVLKFIKPGRHDTDEHIETVTKWLMGNEPGGSGNAQFFFQSACNLVTCILSDMMYSDRPENEKTLAAFWSLLSKPALQLKAHLEVIFDDSPSLVARDLAGTLKDIVSETFSGIYAQATMTTSWLATPSLANIVSGDSFEADDLAKGNLDVYINIPLSTIKSYPAVVKLIIGSMIYTMIASQTYQRKVLFLVDEAYQLGHNFQPFELARDTARKSGVSLALMFQSLGQLTSAYGKEGARAWMDSSAYRIFANVQDQDTAEMLCKLCGEYTALVTQENSSQNTDLFRVFSASKSSGTYDQRKAIPLIRVADIPKLRSDEQIVLIGEENPLRCSKAIYFRRKDMIKMAGENRYGFDETRRRNLISSSLSSTSRSEKTQDGAKRTGENPKPDILDDEQRTGATRVHPQPTDSPESQSEYNQITNLDADNPPAEPRRLSITLPS